MLPAELAHLLGVAIVVYTLGLLAIGWWTRTKIHNHEDFLVAGRRLPLSLAWATILATWFGAGTMLTATDTVREHGLVGAALDPIGAGLCLFLAGWWLARPLWDMRLLTLADFYGRRFGIRAERLSAVLMIPTYLGWIAAQFVALAHLLELTFGIDLTLGIATVAIVGTVYTLLGGMWSVTVTDAIQIVIVALGLFALATVVLVQLGNGSIFDGLVQLEKETPASRLVLVPTDSFTAFFQWMGVLAVGALGSLPGQDLTQRIFAARSAKTAAYACHIAGGLYFVLGSTVLILGLSADLVVPQAIRQTTLTLLAGLLLEPWVAVLFVLAVMSAVLSTIDSALLSPAGVMAENLLGPRWPAADRIALSRWAVVAVAVISTFTAYVGESAYALLETAYELGLVALLVPLLLGLHTRLGGEPAALAAMLSGTALWTLHTIAGWSSLFEPWLGPRAIFVPVGLGSSLFALLAYAAAAKFDTGTFRASIPRRAD